MTQLAAKLEITLAEKREILKITQTERKPAAP